METTHQAERDSLTDLAPEVGAIVKLGTARSRYVTPVALMSKSDRPAFLAGLPEHTALSIMQLGQSINSEFVRPALLSGSGEAYVEFIGKRWHEFSESLHALHTLTARAASEVRADVVGRESIAEMTGWLRSEIVSFAGLEAREELDFAAATLERGIGIISRFPEQSEPRDARRDRQLCKQYQFAVDLYFFALMSLDTAACGAPTNSSVIHKAFELLRHGSLHAYVSAKQAYDLRVPLSIDDDLAPTDGAFDGDDVTLANSDFQTKSQG